jgi:hypothetical protein
VRSIRLDPRSVIARSRNWASSSSRGSPRRHEDAPSGPSLQDRWPKELARAGPTDPKSANPCLREVFSPAYHRRFAGPGREPGSAFVPWVGGGLAEILCVPEERTVAHDHTVHSPNRVLPIPQDRSRSHSVKAKLRVHEHPSGTLAVFPGPRCLGRYDACGHLLAPAQATAGQGSPSSAGRAHA